MSEEIQVKVVSYGPSRCLMMYYVDPVSGKRVSKSTGTTNPGDAEREAGDWEKQLRSGLYQAPSKTTWQQFRERYEREHLATLAPGTQITAGVSLNLIERKLNPDRLIKLTTATISKFQANLREEGMKDTTLARHLRHIKAALSWGVKMGLLAKRPDFIMPKRVKGQTMMKGRPITTEEYERMLTACDKVRPHDAEIWKRLITALWLSGLRLGEAMSLSWDYDAPFAVDFSGRRPVFIIHAQAHKAKRDTLLPMTPDFAQWLLQTFPESERQGKVFKINTLKGKRFNRQEVGRMISVIGEEAKVVVNKESEKYGSAHDLRRAFCTRWASKVKPATLQLLARHADIGTTMKYYVAQDAADVADELWAGFAPKDDKKGQVYNTSYNNQQKTAENKTASIDVTSCDSLSTGGGI